MLKSLFGNRSVEQVLLFLFVNETCYGSQLQSLLNAALTPIQKALKRLEKTGLVKSRFAGKLRLYELNPDSPLRVELENLLKKAYMLLPAHEKRRYCFIHHAKLPLSEEYERAQMRKKALLTIWQRLLTVKRLSFSVKSRLADTKITRLGKAEVQVTTPTNSTIIFQEKGLWDEPFLIAFNNSFRWTLDLQAQLITLEHLRYGAKQPVLLLNLTPTQADTLEAVDPHLCAEDTYLGALLCQKKSLDFHWRIIGPNKNDGLLYQYS